MREADLHFGKIKLINTKLELFYWMFKISTLCIQEQKLKRFEHGCLTYQYSQFPNFYIVYTEMYSG